MIFQKLVLGLCIDPTGKDIDGKVCDLTDDDMWQRVVKKVENEEALLLVMSPIKICEGCLNKNDMITDEIDEMKMKTEEHIKRCVQLYRMQADSEAYSMHENPELAESWNCRHIEEFCVVLNIKKFKYLGTGFEQKNGRHVKMQHMCYLTNAQELIEPMKIIKNVNQIITEREGEIRRLENVPNHMCRIIISGLRNQMRADGRLAKKNDIMMGCVDAVDDDDWLNVAGDDGPGVPTPKTPKRLLKFP